MKQIFFLILISFLNQAIAQNNFRIVFYNVENLFDTYNNPKTNDDEFTEKGMRHWSNYRYWDRIKKTSKTLKIIGEWDTPAIIGLAEIENDTVLKNLIYSDALKKHNYKYIHRDSPDRRGIDVALLYRKDKYFPLITKFFPLIDKNRKPIKSREILYTKGIIKGGDTLNIFVIHFPSRYGGYKNSEPKRINAITQLQSITDSIFKININSKMVIMGDFNDTPNNKSIQILDQNKHISLLKINNSENKGTHKYHGKWSLLDHFFTSNNLQYKGQRVFLNSPTNIYNANFLIEDDKKYLGKKPYRTYIGFKYNGGFSDHLPIYIDLTIDN